MRVVVHYNGSREGADETARTIEQAGGHAIVVQGDLTDPGASQTLIERVLAEHGALDALVNSAAIMLRTPVGEVRVAEWDSMFAINVRAPFFLAQSAAPALARARLDREHRRPGGVRDLAGVRPTRYDESRHRADDSRAGARPGSRRARQCRGSRRRDAAGRMGSGRRRASPAHHAPRPPRQRRGRRPGRRVSARGRIRDGRGDPCRRRQTHSLLSPTPVDGAPRNSSGESSSSAGGATAPITYGSWAGRNVPARPTGRSSSWSIAT